MSRKLYRIVLMPEGKSDFKEYNFSKTKFIFYLSLFIIVFAVILGASSSILTKILYSRDLTILQEEKDLLKQELTYLSKKSNELQEDIDELVKKDDDLRLFADIPRLDKSIWSAGVGGNGKNDLELSTFFENEANKFNEISINLEKFSRVISLQRRSYETTLKFLIENKERSRHLPSIRPVKGKRARLTDRFGYRVNPFNGMPGDYHKGVDIAGIEIGDHAFAAADGVVIKSEYNHFLGNYVKINHDYGFMTLYGHLNKLIAKVGDIVKRGDLIGEVGRTGNATGVHLHYQVEFRGEPIDPLKGYYDPRILY
ncbi:M23 family metallopeptidase [candidate division KSB1 bacterium]